MAALNDTIVAYLTVNNIAFGPSDYQTGQPEGQADQVLHWDIEKLGNQPTQDQLNSAYTTHQANLAAAEQAAAATKASALAKLTALGLTVDEIKAITGA
jgi:hypothetical protein